MASQTHNLLQNSSFFETTLYTVVTRELNSYYIYIHIYTYTYTYIQNYTTLSDMMISLTGFYMQAPSIYSALSISRMHVVL